MNYKKQIDAIVDVLKSGEKPREDYKIGVELEHFIIDLDTGESINYYNGIEDILLELENRGWTGDYEGEHILGLRKDNKVITLEPGSQFEFSVDANESIKFLEGEYNEFLDELNEILEPKNWAIVSTGYHPVTVIDDIKLLPRQRYNYMFNYFKDKGKYAHNMMKGSAALQVSLDYSNEEDYVNKMKVANALGPIFYGITDNTHYFENEIYKENALRSNIWLNMDDVRSGPVPSAFDEDYSYRKYAEYILNMPPIFMMKDGEAIFTGDKLVKDVYDPETFTKAELDHLMSMAFPDVRTKGFVEIRMMDSLEWPYNFAILSAIAGLMYCQKCIDELLEAFKDVTYEEVMEAKREVVKKGKDAVYNGKTILEWALEIMEMAKGGVSRVKPIDLEYIEPFTDLLKEGKVPRDIIREREELGRVESLKQNIMASRGEK